MDRMVVDWDDELEKGCSRGIGSDIGCWLSRPWRSLHGIVGRLHLVTRSNQQTSEVWDSIQTATAQTKSSL